MTRVITSGVGRTTVLDPPIKYSVVDVGGQRNERKKWLHCFDDVKVIVFLISLAGYNQVKISKCSMPLLRPANLKIWNNLSQIKWQVSGRVCGWPRGHGSFRRSSCGVPSRPERLNHPHSHQKV